MFDIILKKHVFLTPLCRLERRFARVLEITCAFPPCDVDSMKSIQCPQESEQFVAELNEFFLFFMDEIG